MIKPRGVFYHSDGSGRDTYIGSNSGGLNNYTGQQEYREAFKRSLRQIDRPQTTYYKQGGRYNGMKKTPSVNTFAHQNNLSPIMQNKDVFTKS